MKRDSSTARPDPEIEKTDLREREKASGRSAQNDDVGRAKRLLGIFELVGVLLLRGRRDYKLVAGASEQQFPLVPQQLKLV